MLVLLGVLGLQKNALFFVGNIVDKKQYYVDVRIDYNTTKYRKNHINRFITIKTKKY